jgi:hypothetical protein
VKTGNWSAAEIAAWLAVKEPNRFGVNIDCEVPRTATTSKVAAAARAAGLKVFSGPCPFDVQPADYFAWTDGIMEFYNVSGPTRFPADVFYFKALSYYYGKPMCMSVQPVDSNGNAVDTASLREANAYATCFEGHIAWGADRLVGSTDAAAASYELCHVRPDVARTPITVKLEKNWKRDMALCRVLAYQGYLPQGSLTAGVSWADLAVPADYFGNLGKFYDNARVSKTVIQQEERGIVFRK